MTIDIREVAPGKTLKDFLNVVDSIYAGDPNYVRPLDMDVGDRLSHKKNPFWEHAEGAAFVAYDNGRPVGRVSVQIDQEHLKRHADGAAFFGFLDTTNDQRVADALLAEAEKYAKARGMKRLRGPLSLSTNDESGCLVEGFDSPPMLMMPHHRDYQGRLIEGAGFKKLKDLYAWAYTPGEVPTRARKAWEDVRKMPEVTSRTLDMNHVERDVRILMDIYTDAWGDKWGFVPVTEKELLKMAADMKLILMPEMTRLVSIDGEPAAVMVALPNVNEVIRDLRGQLFPFGFLKLLWRLKVRGPKSGRLVILGIKHKFRAMRRYGGLSAYLYVEANDVGQKLGITRSELSWTLEDNAPINVAIKMMGGKIYKRYRLYEREI